MKDNFSAFFNVAKNQDQTLLRCKRSNELVGIVKEKTVIPNQPEQSLGEGTALKPVDRFGDIKVWGPENFKVRETGYLGNFVDLLEGVNNVVILDNMGSTLGGCDKTGNVLVNSSCLEDPVELMMVLCHEMTHLKQFKEYKDCIVVCDENSLGGVTSPDGKTYRSVLGPETYPFREAEWEANDLTQNGFTEYMDYLEEYALYLLSPGV